jgi:hypothetical protein
MEFEVERRPGADPCRLGEDARHSIANDNIATSEQIFVAFRMGGKPPGETVEGVLGSVDKARHRSLKPRLDFGNSDPGTVEIGRQYRGP